MIVQNLASRKRDTGHKGNSRRFSSRHRADVDQAGGSVRIVSRADNVERQGNPEDARDFAQQEHVGDGVAEGRSCERARHPRRNAGALPSLEREPGRAATVHHQPSAQQMHQNDRDAEGVRVVTMSRVRLTVTCLQHRYDHVACIHRENHPHKCVFIGKT